MGKYETFIEQYHTLNVVRDEVGSISVAKRLPDGSINSVFTTDVAPVWLDYNRVTRTSRELRVCLRTTLAGRTLFGWLINPIDLSLEADPELGPAPLNSFEQTRSEALLGIGALNAYLQLPIEEQSRTGTIVEDRYRDLASYVDMPPAVQAIQRVSESRRDLSGAELLPVFESALRGAQCP